MEKNFHKAIFELQKVRRFVDAKSVELQGNMLISNNLSDIAYTLTTAIKDLVRVAKIIKAQNEAETDNKTLEIINEIKSVIEYDARIKKQSK